MCRGFNLYIFFPVCADGPKKRIDFFGKEKKSTYKYVRQTKKQHLQYDSATDTASSGWDSASPTDAYSDTEGECLYTDYADTIPSSEATPSSSSTYVQTDDNLFAQFLHIHDWTASIGQGDFITNMSEAIRSSALPKGNICFLLFCELLKKCACSGIFSYSEETLLWWISGLKQFGGKWLRGMQGVPKLINFAATALSTLRRNFGKALATTSRRKPGVY